MWGKFPDSTVSKSLAFPKVIDSIIGIELFQQKFVILKGFLQSEQVKQNMITIVVDQLLKTVQFTNIDV